MNKIIILAMLCLLFSSCSSDDSGIDPSLKLNNYIEPYVNFLVDEDTFVTDNGSADERKDPFTPGFVLIYNADVDGVIEYRYIFTRNNTTYPEGIFTHINVQLEPNSHNLNLVRNALTDTYGVPDYSVQESSDVLVFPPTSTYTISMVYTSDNFTADDGPILIVNYSRIN